MKNNKFKNIFVFFLLLNTIHTFAHKKEKFSAAQVRTIRRELVRLGYENFDDISKLSSTLVGQKISSKIIHAVVCQAYQAYAVQLDAWQSNLNKSIMQRHLPEVEKIIILSISKIYKK